MIELRKEITKLIKMHHSRVYFQTAPNGASFPYVVFDLPNSFTNEQQEVFNLDVDIWDNQSDTTNLETLASTIWRKLNYYSHVDEKIQFSIYQSNRLPPLDEDEPDLKRRKLIFEMKYFDRKLFESE